MERLTITLLRHAHVTFEHPTSLDHLPENRLATNNPSLTDYGRDQLNEYMARWLFGMQPNYERVYVSPMARSLQTGKPIAEHLNIPYTILPWLQEMEFNPEWEGSAITPIKQVIEDWDNTSSYFDYQQGPEGCESTILLRERVKKGMKDIYDELDAGVYTHLLIVSHELTISCIIAELLGIKAYHLPFRLGFMKQVVAELAPQGMWRIKFS